DTGWLDIPGWNLTDRFGWDSDGIRGYVFTDLEDDVMVIALKGTSLATPLVGGGVTSPRDKLMDNLMFSCCCGKAGWSWTPVCDCAQGAARDKQCNVTCLHDATNTGGSYYNLAQTIFLAVKADYPHRYAIWMAGHSLGGALASLTALTHDVPAFTFEAPGDLLYAQRLAL
ncbi:alpha/beta-hydrolase, partial [Caulochytrium protostelioides]